MKIKHLIHSKYYLEIKLVMDVNYLSFDLV